MYVFHTSLDKLGDVKATWDCISIVRTSACLSRPHCDARFPAPPRPLGRSSPAAAPWPPRRRRPCRRPAAQRPRPGWHRQPAKPQLARHTPATSRPDGQGLRLPDAPLQHTTYFFLCSLPPGSLRRLPLLPTDDCGARAVLARRGARRRLDLQQRGVHRLVVGGWPEGN